MIRFMQSHIGLPLTALLIALAVFMLPKLIWDDIQVYKEIGHSISERFHR